MLITKFDDKFYNVWLYDLTTYQKLSYNDIGIEF